MDVSITHLVGESAQFSPAVISSLGSCISFVMGVVEW